MRSHFIQTCEFYKIGLKSSYNNRSFKIPGIAKIILTVRTVLKMPGQYRNCLDSIETIRTVFKQSGKYSNSPDTTLLRQNHHIIWKTWNYWSCPDIIRFIRTKFGFLDWGSMSLAQKLSPFNHFPYSNATLLTGFLGLRIVFNFMHLYCMLWLVVICVFYGQKFCCQKSTSMNFLKSSMPDACIE